MSTAPYHVRGHDDQIDERGNRGNLPASRNSDAAQHDHGIEPRGIVKEIKDITERVRQVAEESAEYRTDREISRAPFCRCPKTSSFV